MSDLPDKLKNLPENENPEPNSNPLEIGSIRRNRKGQFLAGSVPNPKGRPPGSRNRTCLLARALLEERAAELTRKVMDEALAGNPIAYKLCMERLVSIPQDEPIDILLPEVTGLFEPGNTRQIFQAHNALLKALAQGDVTPREAQIVSALIEAQRRSWEALESDHRMGELEDRMDQQPKRRP